MNPTLHERAKKGAAARHSLDTYIKSIVDRAPELTQAQRDKLATVLRPSTPDHEREAG